MRKFRLLALVPLLAALMAGCSGGETGANQGADKSPTTNAAADGPKGEFGSASVAGRVEFKGTPLPTPAVDVSKTPDCVDMHQGKPVPNESFLLNSNGTLKNVFVFVSSGVSGAYSAPAEPAILDQQLCLYRPRVIGVMVGQKIEIKNSDPTFHNVRLVTTANRAINLAQSAGKVDNYQFDKPELMASFVCDVHPWMAAFMGVMEHPFFAVTGDDGAFKIEKLPAGEYEVTAWHERLGKSQPQKIKVGDGETKEITFVFQP